MATQYFAQNRKVGDGTTEVWNFSFAGEVAGDSPYLSQSDIKAALVEFGEGGAEERTPISISIVAPNQIKITPAVADGQEFVIYRETPIEYPVSSFTDFNSVSEDDLDNALKQTLYVVQEVKDRSDDRAETAASAGRVATDAINEAQTATQAASDAQSDANDATSTANTAYSTANTALQTANTALQTANQADDTANQAVLTADSARSTTVSFQGDLDQLQDTVDALLGEDAGGSSNLMLKTDNLAGLDDVAASRGNLDVYGTSEVYKKTETDARVRDASRLTMNTVPTARLPVSSTAAKGVVQLSNSTSSTSQETAATSSAVKAAKDEATAAASNVVHDGIRLNEKATAPSEDAVYRRFNELGSAASRNVGTGSGNVMEVGAFGVGTADVLIDDFNDVQLPNGLYKWDAGGANKPGELGSHGTAYVSGGNLGGSRNHRSRILINLNSDRMFFQRSVNMAPWTTPRRIALYGESYTKSESNNRYAAKGESYTKSESNNRYAAKGARVQWSGGEWSKNVKYYREYNAPAGYFITGFEVDQPGEQVTILRARRAAVS